MRICGECTACCDGWLVNESMGLRPGNACSHCSVKGCQIYDDRPEEPCQVFDCAWLKGDLELAEHDRPDLSGFILIEAGNWREWPVITATPTGAAFDEATFERLKDLCIDRNVALLYTELEQNGESYTGRGWQKAFGPPEFLTALQGGGETESFWHIGHGFGRGGT